MHDYAAGCMAWIYPSETKDPPYFSHFSPASVYMPGRGICACAKLDRPKVVNGRAIYYCVAVKHSPGVGAASPDENIPDAV